MIALVWTLTGLAALMTLLPLVRRDAWWIRACEFPRLQLLVLGVVAFVLALLVPGAGRGASLLAAAAATLQLARILPFSRCWPRRPSRPAAASSPSIGLLVANVLMTNRNTAGLLEAIDERDPDLVLVIEADRWWQEELAELRERFPYAVEHPRDDTYGLLLYSRLPLASAEVRYLVERDVPSIRCRLRLARGAWMTFYGLHPKPPAPLEATETTRRDAELLLVAREVGASPGPTVVAGDLNDVAWSYTTRLFRRLSGLLDPRIGRGLYATFPAERPWLRFPLDHVFHSPDFRLAELEVVPPIGSDHLPLFSRLCFEETPEGKGVEAPEPEPGDVELADEKIERGISG